MLQHTICRASEQGIRVLVGPSPHDCLSQLRSRCIFIKVDIAAALSSDREDVGEHAHRSQERRQYNKAGLRMYDQFNNPSFD